MMQLREILNTNELPIFTLLVRFLATSEISRLFSAVRDDQSPPRRHHRSPIAGPSLMIRLNSDGSRLDIHMRSERS